MSNVVDRVFVIGGPACGDVVDYSCRHIILRKHPEPLVVIYIDDSLGAEIPSIEAVEYHYACQEWVTVGRVRVYAYVFEDLNVSDAQDIMLEAIRLSFAYIASSLLFMRNLTK